MLVETTINLAIEGDLYLRIREVSKGEQDSLSQRRMPVYLSVFALAQSVLLFSVLPKLPRLIHFQRVSIRDGSRRRVCPQHSAVHMSDVSLPANT